jgi:predicted DNA-binding WGR domain protein
MIVVLYKSDSRGRSRYYTIHDRQGNLFSPYSLSVQWGSAPNGGQEKEYIFKTDKEKQKKIRLTIRRRLLDGYKVLYSFSRKPEERTFFNSAVINL